MKKLKLKKEVVSLLDNQSKPGAFAQVVGGNETKWGCGAIPTLACPTQHNCLSDRCVENTKFCVTPGQSVVCEPQSTNNCFVNTVICGPNTQNCLAPTVKCAAASVLAGVCLE